MAGKLKEINSSVLTGAVSSVKLTGIDTDNVYKLVMTNITPSTINADVILRLTEGGTASADSDYDESAGDTTDRIGRLSPRSQSFPTTWRSVSSLVQAFWHAIAPIDP